MGLGLGTDAADVIDSSTNLMRGARVA